MNRPTDGPSHGEHREKKDLGKGVANTAAGQPDGATTIVPPFDPHAWPFFWMTQAVGRYLQRMDTALKKVDLDVSRWRALMCLDRRRPISVSEIADLAIVKLPTMTKLVQRMVAAGLATTAPSSGDGRVTEVLLTAQGEAARRDAWRIAQRIYTQTFVEIGAKDEAELNRILKRVFDLLGGES